LRAACGRWDAGELFLLGAQTVRVQARCARLTKFSVDDDGVESCAVELHDKLQGSAPFSRELPLKSGVIDAILGQPLRLVAANLQSEDKPKRKLAKLATRSTNAHFQGLEGIFVLGSGPGGLTVLELPPRAAAPAELHQDCMVID
jgi:hypothetical protein